MVAYNQRLSLQELVAELDRQKESKLDFVIDGRQLAVDSRGPDPEAFLLPVDPKSQAGEFLDGEGVRLPLKTEKQLAQRLRVPVPGQWIEKMRGDMCGHIIDNVMSDLLELTEKRFLVRTLDGKVRAVLSDKYRVMDNYDLAFTALEAVREASGEVLQCHLTEDHMRIAFTTKELWDRFNEGEKTHGRGSHTFDRLADKDDDGGSAFHPLVTLSNSETGRGGLSVRYGILRARCVNQAILEDAQVEIHLGSKMSLGFLSPETIAADARATCLKCQDAVKAGMHPATFNRICGIAKGSTEVKIEAPSMAVNALVERHDLSEEAKEGILEYFLKDYDATGYGLSQAVSRYSQDVEPEAGYELAGVAGTVMKNAKAYNVHD